MEYLDPITRYVSLYDLSEETYILKEDFQSFKKGDAVRLVEFRDTRSYTDFILVQRNDGLFTCVPKSILQLTRLSFMSL